MRSLVTLLLTLVPCMAAAQPTVGPPQSGAMETIAPGSTVYSTTINCTSSTTTYAMFDAGSTGGGHDDHMPFAHGSRIVVTNLATDQDARCLLSDSPVAQIGDQSSADTANDVTDRSAAPNGTPVQGGTFVVRRGEKHAEVVNWYASLQHGGARNGLCDVPVIGSKTSDESYTVATDRVKNDDLDVYMSCVYDGECADIAGTPATATCQTTKSGKDAVRLSSLRAGATPLRGQHLGCRCTGAAELQVEVKL